jgi:Glycosyltransferase family 87
MSAPARRTVWLIILAGSLARIVWAFATVGQGYDLDNLRMAGDAFLDDPLSVYDRLNPGAKAGPFVLYGWPYPPGLLPAAAALAKLSTGLGLPFHGVVQLLPIAADAGIAWLLQDFLRRRGASGRSRVAATALVALGPAFLVISGYHGQIDSVAILPAVAALWLWERPGTPRRALWVGLLIGLGASVKTVPALLLLALVPVARNLREGAQLVVAAGLTGLVIALPYLLAEPRELFDALGYAGGPGLGGLSMLVQPSLADAFLTRDYPLELSAASQFLYENSSQLVALGVVALGAFLLRFRPSASEAAALVWVTVYVFNPNFFPHYLVWGIPFFVMAGHLGKVALLQAAMIPVYVLFYGSPWDGDGAAVLYVLLLGALWLCWLWALVAGARRAVQTPSPARTG